MSDLISVIIPTYNYGKYIEEAIKSVLQQDYAPLEIVIVDDGSTDNTREIVNPYLGDNVRYFYQENKGNAAARNFGILQANGEYIAQLDADDLYLPHKLSRQMAYMKAHPECEIVFTLFRNVFSSAEEREIALRLHPSQDVSLNHTTMLARKELFFRVGFYDECHRVAPDVYWQDRLSLVHKIPFVSLPEVFLLRRVHLDSISNREAGPKARVLLEHRCALLRAQRVLKKK